VIDVPRLQCWSLLRDLESFGIVLTTAFYESNLVKSLLAQPTYHIFPTLVE
jgi:hypothetical protein